MSSSTDRHWRTAAAWLGGAVLGLVLLIAAWSKAVDPLTFGEQIGFEGLDFVLPANAVAWMVIVAEVGLGIALLIGLRTRAVLVSTGGLIVVFLMLTGRAYWRWLHGIEIEGYDCGCYGNLISRTPAEAFWQDLLLLVPGYAMSWLDVIAGSKRRVVVAALAAMAASVFTLAAPELPLDDLATRLSSGRQITELCAGSSRREAERVCLDLLVPELLEGRHLVIIDRLDGDGLAGHVEELNETALSGREGVWALTTANETERQVFFWEHGPVFEVREVPAALLRPLYRTLPRSFVVEDGTVTRTWSGLPSSAGAGDGV